jgi:hypothetical protein
MNINGEIQDGIMDEASRKLISQMMAEEEQQFGFSTETPSASSFRWSPEETEALISSLVSRLYSNTQKIHGRNYKEICKLFSGSRTEEQIKNKTKYLLQNGQLKESDLRMHESPLVVQHRAEPENIVIAHGELKIETTRREPSVELDIDDDGGMKIDDGSVEMHGPLPVSQIIPAVVEMKRESLETQDFDPSLPIPQRPLDQPPPARVQLDNVTISKNSILKIERDNNVEFFSGERTSKNRHKTPERYTLIRNYILNLWETNKPSFVTKSASRKGLIGNGDVSAISRVWEFLDEVGAINQGAARKGVKKAATKIVYEEDVVNAAGLSSHF